MKRAAVIAMVPLFGAALFAMPRFVAAPEAWIPTEPDPVVLVFAGDIMLDRNVAKWGAAAPEALFASTTELFAGADLRIINLEGTITTEPSVARRDSSILRFTFDPEFARRALSGIAPHAASLANNHTLDFGAAGYDSTRRYLEEWGIVPFGHALNARGLSAVLVVRETRVCVVGYHQLFDPSTKEVLAEIGRLRPECDVINVFAHWGEEYTHEPSPAQKRIAHEFIDEGADAVVGAHPHVVQSVEVYEGRPIFYSLGNFMFDQEFSWETKHGLLLRMELGERSARYTLNPVRIDRARVAPAPEGDRAEVLRIVAAGSSEELGEGILAGSFELPRPVAPGPRP